MHHDFFESLLQIFFGQLASFVCESQAREDRCCITALLLHPVGQPAVTDVAVTMKVTLLRAVGHQVVVEDGRATGSVSLVRVLPGAQEPRIEQNIGIQNLSRQRIDA